YATAVTPRTKGSAASNPISVSSTKASTPTRTSSVSFAAAPTAAVVSSPAALIDYVQQMNAMSAQVDNSRSRFEEFVRNNTLEMKAMSVKMDRIYRMLEAISGQAPAGIEPEDIELELAPALSSDVVPSTPPSSPPPSTSASTSASTSPSPAQQKPYSVEVARPHHIGGEQNCKGDPGRFSEDLARKLPSARNEQESSNSQNSAPTITQLQEQILLLQQQAQERGEAFEQLLSKSKGISNRVDGYMESTGMTDDEL
ncbi:hypothetical protein BGX29_004086, partial [Mortierella sp. GBA35]